MNAIINFALSIWHWIWFRCWLMRRCPVALPNSIQTIPNSDELSCLHEAGHVHTLVKAGCIPEFVEIYSSPSPHGRTRARRLAEPARTNVLASGYAVELALFKSGRLADAGMKTLRHTDPDDVRRFIQQAVGQNAHEDKVLCFGGNHLQANQCWPKHLDQRFMARGETLSGSLDLRLVETFATALLKKRRLDAGEIAAIARQFGLV